MTAKQLLQRKLKGESVERVLFCPAIYEHKARLLDRSVSDVARDAALLVEAVFAEYEIYRPDMLTVGIDVYNIEAETAGSKVSFPSAANAVPYIAEHFLSDIDQVQNLPDVDVRTAGRMPIITDAVGKVSKKLGDQVAVRGAVSGPFSMAGNLMGIEPLIMAQAMKPKKFEALLDYCGNVIVDFGKSFIEHGASVCVFDSQACPPFISPDIYEQIILPRLKEIARRFKDAGAEFTELVVGGQTDAIAGSMKASGFDIVLSDFGTDFKSFINCMDKDRPIIRRNISPVLIEEGPSEELDNQIRDAVRLACDFDNVIIGTGVLGYDSCVENILNVKKMVFDNY